MVLGGARSIARARTRDLEAHMRSLNRPAAALLLPGGADASLGPGRAAAAPPLSPARASAQAAASSAAAAARAAASAMAFLRGGGDGGSGGAGQDAVALSRRSHGGSGGGWMADSLGLQASGGAAGGIRSGSSCATGLASRPSFQQACAGNTDGGGSMPRMPETSDRQGDNAGGSVPVAGQAERPGFQGLGGGSRGGGEPGASPVERAGFQGSSCGAAAGLAEQAAALEAELAAWGLNTRRSSGAGGYREAAVSNGRYCGTPAGSGADEAGGGHAAGQAPEFGEGFELAGAGGRAGDCPGTLPGEGGAGPAEGHAVGFVSGYDIGLGSGVRVSGEPPNSRSPGGRPASFAVDCAASLPASPAPPPRLVLGASLTGATNLFGICGLCYESGVAKVGFAVD